MRTNKCPFGIPDCKYKMYSTSRVFIYIIQYQTQLGLNFVLPHPFFLKLCNLFCPLLLSLPFGYYFSLKKHIGSVNLLTPLTLWFFYVCSCIMIICVLEHSCIFPLYGCFRENRPGMNLRENSFQALTGNFMTCWKPNFIQIAHLMH